MRVHFIEVEKYPIVGHKFFLARSLWTHRALRSAEIDNFLLVSNLRACLLGRRAALLSPQSTSAALQMDSRETDVFAVLGAFRFAPTLPSKGVSWQRTLQIKHIFLRFGPMKHKFRNAECFSYERKKIGNVKTFQSRDGYFDTRTRWICSWTLRMAGVLYDSKLRIYGLSMSWMFQCYQTLSAAYGKLEIESRPYSSQNIDFFTTSKSRCTKIR